MPLAFSSGIENWCAILKTVMNLSQGHRHNRSRTIHTKQQHHYLLLASLVVVSIWIRFDVLFLPASLHHRKTLYQRLSHRTSSSSSWIPNQNTTETNEEWRKMRYDRKWEKRHHSVWPLAIRTLFQYYIILCHKCSTSGCGSVQRTNQQWTKISEKNNNKYGRSLLLIESHWNNTIRCALQKGRPCEKKRVEHTWRENSAKSNSSLEKYLSRREWKKNWNWNEVMLWNVQFEQF